MKTPRIGIVVLLCIIVTLSACNNTNTDSTVINKSQVKESDDLIELRKETEHFEFYCVESDVECLEDLAGTLEENYTKITTDLKTDLDFKVKVHVYKDIDTFHKATGLNDSPAWGVGIALGNGIQIVSPLNPGPKHSYQTMIQVVVHEFTHVEINNIAQSWMIPLKIN